MISSAPARQSPALQQQAWRTFHKVNAVILVLFLFMHLATHVSGIFGIETYNAVQKALRLVYRNPVTEPIVLASISLQLLTGMVLLVRTLRQGRPRGLVAWAQVLSGGFFFVFMAQHLFSLGMARLYFGLETNFFWPASVMSGPPYTYYFFPYYFLGVWAVMVHAGIGIRYWLLDAGHERLGNDTALAFAIGGALVSAFILPILAGAYFDIELPREWIEYLRFYVPDFKPA